MADTIGDFLSSWTGGLVSMSAALAAILFIWQKFMGPYVAKPVAKTIAEHIGEIVEKQLNEKLDPISEQLASMDIAFAQYIADNETELEILWRHIGIPRPSRYDRRQDIWRAVEFRRANIDRRRNDTDRRKMDREAGE